MKRLFLLALAVLGLVAAPAARADQHGEYVKHVETCEAILREFMADQAYAIPPSVLQSAHGIIIMRQFKAGFIFGATGGYGVIMVKRSDNTWSIPVLINGGGVSVGLQAGGKSIETIYVLTDDETPRRLFEGRINIGVDAKAVMGPKWTEVESVNKELLAAPVLVYTKSTGLYAGATVKAGYLSRNDDANREFYRTGFTMPELLYGNFVEAPAEVKPLIDYMKQLSP
jgi:lipid-binding SYLF domain-containing protein